MNQRSMNCCGHDQLQALLDETLAEPQRTVIVDHLSDCAICAKRLQLLAAEEEFWQSSADSLRCDELDRNTAVRNAADRGTADWPTESLASSGQPLSVVLQSLLAPTDDPCSLGRIGRFEVLGVVGSGGMGTVLKARDVDIDRVVALKLPAAHLLDSPSALERIEREARSAATIRHPSIIEIYQVQRWRGIPYLVMPYHTGPSLTARITSDGQLQLLEAMRVARQTAEALAAAHDHGIVHRDVKPGNILLGKGTERAVLTDFGIAKIQSDVQVTATGVIVGTPAFLSPEQACGDEATPSSDLFCLGSVLWTMLAGRAPFENLPTHSIVAALAAGKVPSLKQQRSELPSWTYRLVEWLHALDPLHRPASAHVCAEVLRACEQHLIDPTSHPLPAIMTTPAPQNRPWIRVALLLAVLIGVTSVSMIVALQPPRAVRVQPVLVPRSNVGQVQPAEPVMTALDQLTDSVDQLDREMADLLDDLETLAGEATAQ